MKKIAGLISVFLLAIFIALAALAEPKLKYDFDYLFKWTASAMKIEIDSEKPQPKLRILPEKEVQRLYEEKYDEKVPGKVVIKKGGIEKTYEVCFFGFYDYSENTVFVKDNPDVARGDTLEWYIVHELAHYFQDFYRSLEFDKQNDPCWKDPCWFWNCPWEKETRAIQRKFRIERNLFIRNEDLD